MKTKNVKLNNMSISNDHPMFRISKYTHTQSIKLFDVFRITRPDHLRQAIDNSLCEVFIYHSLFHLLDDNMKEQINNMTNNLRRDILSKYDAGNVDMFKDVDKKELVHTLIINHKDVTEEELKMLNR